MILAGRGSARFLLPSPRGRRWTATGVLFSRRGPDEGLLHRTLGVKSSCPSLEILDQHRVGRVRAAGEGKAANLGPVEIENLVRSEMCYGFRRATHHWLFPNVTHAVHAVDERNGAAIKGTNEREDRPERWWVAGKPWRVGRPRMGLSPRAIRLVLAGREDAGNPPAVGGNRCRVGVLH